MSKRIASTSKCTPNEISSAVRIEIVLRRSLRQYRVLFLECE